MRIENDQSRLPIKIDSTSNGEYVPLRLPKINVLGNSVARETISRCAVRLKVQRRRFLHTACAAAATLFSFNSVNSAAGRQGGRFAVSEESLFDNELAVLELGGDEFIFDAQGHYVVPPSLVRTLKPDCRNDHPPLSRDYMRCLGADAFIKDVFLDSDTDMMMLSFVPSLRSEEPLTIAEAAATREIVERMGRHHRLLIHGRVNPNQAGDLESMDELAERWGISAWKCYTQWGPEGRGFFLDDPIAGIPFIENAVRLGIRNICIHKGIPFGKRSYEHSLCTDIGRVAAQFPNVNFLVYHSGYIPGRAEGPYDPTRGEGVDELIRSVLDAGLGRHSNVYAELGTTWRLLMRDPVEAAHCLGKLVKYLGEDNVLYGSDSVWYGSPQDQIQAFRAFQISAEFQERFGYPAMTKLLRAKIFGLNAAHVYGIELPEVLQRARGDAVATAREEYRNAPVPHFGTYGPRTRREFVDLMKRQGNNGAS
jgi:uncharacterized protein